MYKGNMYEFVERVSEYTQRVYGKTFELGYQDLPIFSPKGGFESSYKGYVIWDKYMAGGATGSIVTDSEDFEQQVYDFVNRRLDDSVNTKKIIAKLTELATKAVDEHEVYTDPKRNRKR